ncbi:hypothetical protein GF420_10610 [candidate division GN15 bacterium]|nr:hypothetical protein [candidate division GN15 bacterium]
MRQLTSSSELIRRLHGILLKQRLVLFGAGLVLTAAAVLACAVVLSLVANVVVLPVWLKITLMSLAGLAALVLFGRYALARLFEGNVDRVAVGLEQKHPDLKGRLVAAVQFARMAVNEGFSKDLIQANERQALEKAGLVNFNSILSFHPVLKASRLLAVSATLAVLLLAFFPGFFSYSYEVYSNPTEEIAPPLAYELSAVPGSTEWIKYRDIEIGGAIVGQRIPTEAKVHYRLAGGQWQTEKVNLVGRERTPVAIGDSLAFGITLRQINKSFDYYVEAGRLETAVQKVDVVDRPRVNDIHLSVFYPDYTELEPTTIDENNGSFSAVVGSRANIRIETNQPVEKAELVFEDSSRTPLDLDGKTAQASLVVENSRSYHIRLKDHLGEVNPDPIEYYITAVPDEYPSVDVVKPGFNANLTEEMLLPLMVRIYDDFGFSSLVLKYHVVSGGRTSDENVAVLHFSDKIKTEGEVSFNWDMDQLNLFPGDYVSYYFEVADNDVISGPKVSKSRTYIARLPSLDEIVAQTEQETTRRITTTEDLLRSGEELTKRLRDAARKLKAQNRNEQTADWQQKKELEAIAQKNEEMVSQVEQMAEQMEKSLDELRKNALMSREILEKLDQIQKLFEEVATPEMREAQKKLMEALEKMDRNELQQAMKDFELSQEDMMKRLERQLALLKKMQVEQKMESMLRKAEELLKRQDKMNADAEQADSQDLPKMSRREQEIEQGLEQLKKEAEELREMLEQEEVKDLPQPKEFAEALEKTDADRDMQQMQSSMQQQNQEQAVKQGKQASSKLTQMIGSMQQQLAQMQGQDSQEIQRAMRRAIEDANYLSEKQEELLNRVGELAPRSATMRDLATSQQDLQGACNGLKNSIGELGKQSPFIAAELQSLVDNAASAMNEAIQGLDALRSAQAVQQQREAMFQLNKTSLRLMESLDQQQQCQSAAQCDKNMAQLEKLSQQQQQLNQQTQNQCNNPQQGQGGKMSEAEQMRQGLKRLAGEQGSIRKSMQQLADEFAGSRQVLGRLDDIADEMKEVEEALASGEVGAETTERQLRIYSRMLEASRSLQRRDFSDQRKATTAENNPTYVPPALPAELLNDRTQFEDRLKRYLGDDYPAQYEEQIKAYFRALMQTEAGSETTAQ